MDDTTPSWDKLNADLSAYQKSIDASLSQNNIPSDSGAAFQGPTQPLSASGFIATLSHLPWYVWLLGAVFVFYFYRGKR